MSNDVARRRFPQRYVTDSACVQCRACLYCRVFLTRPSFIHHFVLVPGIHRCIDFYEGHLKFKPAATEETEEVAP